MTTKETLQAARDYIADPEKWIKRAMEDEDGAVCSAGAIHKVKPNANLVNDPAVLALASVLPQSPSRGDECAELHDVTYFNDHNSHDCVVAAFDAAIEKCK